ncbi:MAG TPA: peptide chain release factor N(5)-glutamine methyltransferase [Stellaceae bacterium]|nr:peptide chain release factor N(5)-glutamine methyltransferase [Stellaceae bacterium]
MTPRTVGSALAEAAAALAGAGFDEPRRHARRLVAAAMGVSAAEIFAAPERPIRSVERRRVAELLRRTLAHEPMSRILGEREFWGLRFRLSPDTLDPRPETETVVETVLAHLPRGRPLRLLDLGTGSGCLLLALLSELPEAMGIGIDLAEGAIRNARENAAVLGLADRARFAVGDWGSALRGGFDAVVSNPPYIASGDIAGLPPEVVNHDPRRALDGGADGLAAYRSIAADLPRLLAPGGLFAAEIGQGQADAVAAILAEAGVAATRVVPDLAGVPRCVVAANRASAAAWKAKNCWNAAQSRLGCAP